MQKLRVVMNVRDSDQDAFLCCVNGSFLKGGEGFGGGGLPADPGTTLCSLDLQETDRSRRVPGTSAGS